MFEPLIEWADSIIKSDDPNKLVKLPDDIIAFNPGIGVNLSVETFEVGDEAFVNLVAGALQRSYGATVLAARVLAEKLNKLCIGVELDENWVKHPISHAELRNLFMLSCSTLNDLHVRSESKNLDVSLWPNRDEVDKVLWALTIILVWQPFRYAIQFIYLLPEHFLFELNELSKRVLASQDFSSYHCIFEANKARIRYWFSILSAYSEHDANIQLSGGPAND